MADNLVTMSYMGDEILHTYSKYNKEVSFSRPSDAIIENSIQQLRDREQQVYMSFSPGCTSFESFVRLFRSLFSGDYEKDKAALLNFSNPVLFSIIEQARAEYQKNSLAGKSWQFTLNVDNKAAERLIQLENKLGSSTELKFIKEIGLWEIIQKDFDIVEVKKIMNAAFGTKFWAGSGKRGASSSKKAMQEFINKLSDDTFKWIKGPDSINSLYMEYEDPFSYGAEKLHAAESSPEERAEIEAGMLWIKNVVRQRFLTGVSTQLQRAFDVTWQANFTGANWQNISLFMKKGGATALSGAFGEFQAALITNYTAERFSMLSNNSKAVISNSLSSEQSRRDITILNSFGIQVKNYDPRTALNLTTTVYPETLRNEPAFQDGNIKDIFRFLANYYFNLSYAIKNGETKNELTDSVLPAYFAQIANLDLGEIFRRDVVSFYLISGRYFVPASHIAESVYRNQLYAPVQITSSYSDAHTDQEFNKTKDPLYPVYWERTNGNWTPTDKNKTLYKNLLSKEISIRTSFSRTNFTVADYDLFL